MQFVVFVGLHNYLRLVEVSLSEVNQSGGSKQTSIGTQAFQIVVHVGLDMSSD